MRSGWVLVAALALVACGDVATAQREAPDGGAQPPVAQASPAPATGAAAARTAPGTTDGTAALLSRLQRNFDRATRGERGAAVAMAAVPDPAGAGMTCTPARLSPDRPDLSIDLPTDLAARRNVLAVITPERGLQVIYEPYSDAVEAGDLVIPDHNLSWERARANSHFAVRTDALDAVRPGGDEPFGVFLEPGVYQFALINGTDRALLDANRTAFRVVAGCTVAWTPDTAR